MSLSTLPSRFAVEAEFDWNFDNYVTAFTDFAPQFQRAFVYAGTATILTILIGYPLAYVIAFRGGTFPNPAGSWSLRRAASIAFMANVDRA